MNYKRPTYGIGSISTDTLRTEHILTELIWHTETYVCDSEASVDAHVATLKDILSKYSEGDDTQDALQDAIEECWPWLPPYTHMGMHMYDGADFGVFVDFDQIEQLVRDDEILAVSDLSEVPDDYTGDVYYVNDHGNAALYTAQNGSLEEVWGVV